MSPFFSASCAFEKSSCALPLISSSPGARYFAFSPGLKITEPAAGPGEAHQIKAGKISMRKEYFIALRRVATLPGQSSWPAQQMAAQDRKQTTSRQLSARWDAIILRKVH